MKKDTAKTAELELLFIMTLFGTIALVRRYIPLPSAVVADARSFIGFAFLLVFTALRGIRLELEAVKKNFIILACSGVSLGINWVLLFEAYRYTSTAVAVLCNYVGPVFVIIGSVIFFGEKLSLRKFICVCMALGGVFLVSDVLQSGLPLGSNLLGIVCGLVSAVFYAVAVLFSKKLTSVGSYEKTIVQLGASAFVILPYVLLTEKISAMQFTPLSVALLVMLGVLHTGMAYAIYFHALNRVSLQTFSFFAYIEPVLTIILSAAVLKEPLTLPEIFGACLILGATLVSRNK